MHQSFALPPSFTVAEALEFVAGGGLDLYSRRRLLQRCRERLAALALDVDPRRPIRDLPVESQQGVEIARALVTDAGLLITDEPTAVLPPAGIEALFERIRGLKRHGVTVILILHKIREVLAVADTIAVLRAGRLVAGPIPRESADETGIAEMIVGHAGRGFMSFAAVIFGASHPIGAAFAAVFFSLVGVAGIRLQLLFGASIPHDVLLSLPYLATILGVWVSGRMRGGAKAATEASELRDH